VLRGGSHVRIVQSGTLTQIWIFPGLNTRHLFTGLNEGVFPYVFTVGGYFRKRGYQHPGALV